MQVYIPNYVIWNVILNPRTSSKLANPKGLLNANISIFLKLIYDLRMFYGFVEYGSNFFEKPHFGLHNLETFF